MEWDHRSFRGGQTFILIQAWRGLCPSTQIRVAGLALAFLARSVSFEVALLAGSWAIFFPYPKVINRLASLPSPLRGRGAGGEGGSRLAAERSGDIREILASVSSPDI